MKCQIATLDPQHPVYVEKILDKGKTLGQGQHLKWLTPESSSSTYTYRNTPGQQVALDCVCNHAAATVVSRCCTESQGPAPSKQQ